MGLIAYTAYPFILAMTIFPLILSLELILDPCNMECLSFSVRSLQPMIRTYMYIMETDANRSISSDNRGCRN